MQIIQNKTKFELDGNSAVAIGKFDGIHLGHQKLLRYLFMQKEEGHKAVIFTFDPPPSFLFKKKESTFYDKKVLLTKEEKRTVFDKMGVDVLVEFPLNMHTASILPEDFIAEILVKQLHAKYIAAGTDVSFGDKGAGNCMLLQAMSEHWDYQVDIIEKVCHEGNVVSSTRVREAVEKGRMEEAAVLLGEPYKVGGTVVYGNRFGRTIGMPTVNLIPHEFKLLPQNGVYYSTIIIDNKSYYGITNIGYKPTVSEEKKTGVETFIYDFDEEIYGKEIWVNLLAYKRAEERFDGKDTLKRQMEKDIEEGRIFHRKKPF